MSNDIDRHEILEILTLALDDIDRIKQQQWRDFYAILAAQGALLVLFKEPLCLRWFFIIVSLFTGVFGALLIRDTQHTLESKFRARQNRALAALGRNFIAMWNGPDSPDEREGRNVYPNMCVIVLGVGTAFVIVFLLKYPPALF